MVEREPIPNIRFPELNRERNWRPTSAY